MNLTEDDKKWIEKLMDRFATKEELGQFATKADLGQFATKADLGQFATKADLEQFATKADLEQFATKADLERVETNLLTQFHAWASPIEARQRLHSANFRTIEVELESLSDRIKKLEGPGPS